MHRNPCITSLSRFPLAVLIVLHFTTLVPGQAGGEQRPEIPSAPVEPGEMVREIARLAEQIEDPKERMRTLSSVLYRLEPIAAPQRQPVIDAMEKIAPQVDDQTLTSRRESVIRHAPEAALRIARRMDDRRHREHYLADLVARITEDRPDLAEELLEEIQLPKSRYQALVAYAKADSAGFQQTTSLLREAAGLDFAGHYPEQRAVEFRDALLRFAGERPDSVFQFLTEHLEPGEVVAASAGMAWELSHRRNAPEAAEHLVEQAETLIPRTDEPAKWTMRLLDGGSAQLEPAEAADLFDEYILPKIARGGQRPAAPLSPLAKIGMDLFVSRAEAAADALDKPLIEVLPEAVGRVARESDPDRVLAWLVDQPPSPLRAACTAAIAGKIDVPAWKPPIPKEKLQERIEITSDLIDEIEDPETRWQAVNGLLDVVEKAGMPDQDLRRQWRNLWYVVSERGEGLRYDRFDRLPLDEQRERIAERLEPTSEKYWKGEEHPPWITVQFLSHSSLSDAEKKDLYREMAAQADGPMTMAAIARYLASLDYPQALELMWRALPEERNPRTTRQDTWPPLAPPKNANAALNWLKDGRDAYLQRDEAETVITALWSHAHSVPEVDQPAILEELSRVLREDRQYEQSLGVAQQIDDLPKRLVLMSGIIHAAASDG